MRKMLRRSLSVVALFLSLVPCGAVVFFRAWGRSGSPLESDRFGISIARPRGRYTMVPRREGFVLSGPPAPTRKVPGRTPAGETAAAAAARLDNGQIRWAVEQPVNWRPMGWRDRDRKTGPWEGSPRADEAAPAGLLVAGYGFRGGPTKWFSEDELVPLLLRALEEPSRFVAAHVLLTEIGRAWHHEWEERADGTFVQTANGLRVELRRDPADKVHIWHSYDIDSEFQNCLARVEPEQLPAIREKWHRRFDVPILVVPYWQAGGVAALPPLALVGPAFRRARVAARRRRLGLCRRCGYDLRASPGRCSECGTASGSQDPPRGVDKSPS